MNSRLVKRVMMIIGSLSVIFLGIIIILYNLENNITFFVPPSKLHTITNYTNPIRIGGIVKTNSIHKRQNYLTFIITDSIEEIKINYYGILPTLFREGQGIIALGYYDPKNKLITAQELLTKHDENYKPPQVD